MSLILLFDLDNTLLGNDMDRFVPAYLQELSQALRTHLPPEKLVSALLRATNAMLENQNPGKSLKSVFDESFYPQIGLSPESLQEPIAVFYHQQFPRLRSLTQPRPEAVTLIQNALDRGYRLAIATNPLFPQTAILQRLEWAGLSPERYPFDVIPSYESFHFAKPNPAFFAELLARLGWPEEAVVMIGDDFERDIRPSLQMGIPTFWVRRPSDPPDDSLTQVANSTPHHTGWLSDILPWIEATDPTSLKPDFDSPTGILATLRSTPAVIAHLTSSVQEPLWQQRPQPQEWCLTEIVCHLEEVEAKLHLPRIQRVLMEYNPFLPAVDTDRWSEEHQYIRKNGRKALDSFITCRMETVKVLAQLQLEDWHRPARHSIFGPTHLQELTSIIAGHDRLHLQQIRDTLSRMRHHNTPSS